MRKILSLALSAVLLIFGFIVPQSSDDISFESGRGERLNSFEEILEALDSADALASGSSLAEYDSISFSVKGEQILDYQYTREIYGERHYVAMEGTVNYEIEGRINDDGETFASYNVIMSAEGSSSSEIETAYIKVKLDMYESDEDRYLRIRQYYSTSRTLLPAEKAVYLNKWLDISEGDFTGVTREIPISVLGIIETMAECLELYEDDFKKDGDSLIINREKTLSEIFSSMSSASGLPIYVEGTVYEDSKIEIDMSNEYAPEIIIVCEANYENVDEDGFIFGPENSATVSIKLFDVDDTDFDCDLRKSDIYDEEDVEDIFDTIGRGR